MTTMIRVATAADTDTLLNSLLEAANWNGEPRKSRDDIRSSKYVVGWPANGDFGVIAEDGEGNGLGSAWCRFFAEENAGYGFVRERGCNAVSLSVEDGNPARRLYERSGFIKVGRNGNSDTLLLEFSAI